eukprot:9493979-Pyramimonas_sp.AAC.1
MCVHRARSWRPPAEGGVGRVLRGRAPRGLGGLEPRAASAGAPASGDAMGTKRPPRALKSG